MSATAGIRALAAPGLGVVCHDFTGDGRLDFFVANDGRANHLWVNRGDGAFVEEAMLFGAALNGFGRAEAGMGVDIGDLNGDGALDLVLTHFGGETNTVYLTGPWPGFRDATIPLGMGTLGLGTTGFGVALGDWNHDGRLDALVANGRVARPAGIAPREPFLAPYAEPALLLANEGRALRGPDRRLAGSPRTGSPPAGSPAGDLDGDGDLDLVLTANEAGARLLRNESGKQGPRPARRPPPPRGAERSRGGRPPRDERRFVRPRASTRASPTCPSGDPRPTSGFPREPGSRPWW